MFINIVYFAVFVLGRGGEMSVGLVKIYKEGSI